jgi:hypothetical protein
MKHLINKVFLILLLIFVVTCKKKDDKIEELIIGEWEVESKTFLGYSPPATNNLSTEYIFDVNNIVEEGRCASGCSKDINGEYSTSGSSRCYTEYKIENGNLFILNCNFYITGLVIDSVSQIWFEIPIKKINQKKMILIEYFDGKVREVTYRKK